MSLITTHRITARIAALLLLLALTAPFGAARAAGLAQFPGILPGISMLLMLDTPSEQAAAELLFPVVDTRQDTCYDEWGWSAICPSEGDSMYGQDANYTLTQPEYVDNQDGTVTDNTTGLIWTQSPDTTGDGTINYYDKLTYSEAAPYCEALSLGGRTDWRLPTIKELYSLFDGRGYDPMVQGNDTSGLRPFIDTDYFDFAYGDGSSGDRIIDMQYATATTYVADDYMFGVNFADGRIKGYGYGSMGPNGEKTFCVMCVTGDTDYGVNNFVDNGDGTVTDNASGLMWAQDDSGQGMDWYAALEWIQTLNSQNYLGYSDWRLPDVKELQSIVDYSRSPDTTGSAAIDPVFSATPITNEGGAADYGYYWSSTTHIRYGGSGKAAMYVSFGRALGYMFNQWIDIHGAGAQRSDPKMGDPSDYPTGHGPQGDAIRIYNFVRPVRTTVVTAADTTTPQAATEEYTLVAPINSTEAWLVDENLSTVTNWETGCTPGLSSYLLDDGTLVRTCNTGPSSTFGSQGGVGGRVQLHDPDGSVRWSFDFAQEYGYWQHHDVEYMDNGNILMVAWEYKTSFEASAAGRSSSLLPANGLWPDTIVEVKPNGSGGGEIVWEWRVWDHLVQDENPSLPTYGNPADHPERIDLNYVDGRVNADWNHINSVDYNAERDEIIVSVRSFSEIWVIDHSLTTAEAATEAGDLLYRWGNPQAWSGGSVSEQELFGQHDAEWIPDTHPGAGNILIYNNGKGRPDGDYSSVVEVSLPETSTGYAMSGGAFADPTVVWEYSAGSSFFSSHISGAQRLASGNTLICEGDDARVFEVTTGGDIEWEYQLTSGQGMNSLFRADKYTEAVATAAAGGAD